MATGIISLLAIALSFAFWWWKRSAAEKADPVEQHREDYKQVDAELSERSWRKASGNLRADLDELERLERAGTLPDGRGSVGSVSGVRDGAQGDQSTGSGAAPESGGATDRAV